MSSTQSHQSTRARAWGVVLTAAVLATVTGACGDSSADESATTPRTETSSGPSTSAGGEATEGGEVVGLMAAAGLVAEFNDEELACIDDTFAGVDMSLFTSTFDPFAEYVDDDVMTRTGQMFDECLRPEVRVALVKASMTNAQLGTDDQLTCAAAAFDAVVLAAGTWVELMTEEIDVNEQALAALADCGIDLGDEVTAGECESELRTVETAIEAYYATNGVDATGYADLVPDYLLEDLSADFEIQIGSDGVPVVVGVARCDGYGG